MLAFLPGAAEIHRVSGLLEGSVGADVDLRPLYGALPAAAQDAALAPSPPGRRRVVLATDIAESSLTVPGVRIVVDAGLVRGPRYDAGTGLTRLVTRTASRAAADQRAGRAGRLAPGVAHRCWAEADHQRRAAFPDPEIAVVDLAGLVLELAVWGSGPGELAFLDPPPRRAWAEAEGLLHQLGALDGDGRPTAVGRQMIGLPLHPRLARMVVDGDAAGEGRAAVVLAALLEERDVLRGRRDDRPADLAERVALVAERADGASVGSPGAEPSRSADRDAVRIVRRRSRELARRMGVGPGRVDPTGLGPLVALAYPDRIAQARGGGRFRFRAGGGGWLADTDPLASAPFLAVADVEAGAGDGRIRTAAALDLGDVRALVGDDVETITSVAWDEARGALRARTETRAGALVLAAGEGRAQPGPAAVAALLDQVRAGGGALLGWTDAARSLQARIGFLRRVEGERWPDVGDAALLASLDDWLAPHLARATGRGDVARVDLTRVLRSLLDHRALADLDRLAPRTLTLASGREVTIDYGTGAGEAAPSVAVRVQDLYGTTRHPTVADGRVPIVLHLLSPAGRPVQVTADLPRFWAGSWQEVRKEMAGRYPKHAWPTDPATAAPRPPGRRR